MEWSDPLTSPPKSKLTVQAANQVNGSSITILCHTGYCTSVLVCPSRRTEELFSEMMERNFEKLMSSTRVRWNSIAVSPSESNLFREADFQGYPRTLGRWF